MLSPVSKLFLAITLAALTTALAYKLAVDDRAGTMLLVFLGVAALVACIATAGGSVPDQAPVVPADAPPPERRATTTGGAPRGSAWPAGAALAVAVLGATAAAGGKVVLVGVIALLVAAAGWFSKVWGEHPTWTPRLRERVSFRLLVPVGLPVGMFLLVGTIAISISRILLAVSKDASVVVAFIVAISVLGVCSWLATRPRITSSAVLALVGVAVMAVAGAGITGVAAGERTFHPEAQEKIIQVHARQVKFDTAKISAVAGENVTIEFSNGDAGVYHNMAVYQGDGVDSTPVFNGQGIPGVSHHLYTFKAPPAGAYVFVCDFHPNMKGTFVSEPK